MKKLLVIALIFAAPASFAKLSDRQTMTCIDTDKLTKSAFQDLQAAYEMRLVTAKDFFQVMDKAPGCPQLRTDIKKLHATAMAQLPRSKGSLSRPGSYSSASPSPNAVSAPSFDNNYRHDNFNDSDLSYPPPPALQDSDFGYDDDSDDDFGDFR